MYVNYIRLTNVKCFRDGLELNLSRSGSPRRWATLVGDNGSGKTSLLRALCIGLCDEAGGYSLLTELWGEFARDTRKPAVIEIEVWNKGKTHRLRTEISTTSADTYKISQNGQQLRRFPFKDRFVCAYGAGREISGTFEYDEYSVVDAVYTLFNYGQQLQNPELTMRRWAEYSKVRALQMCRWLEHVLILKRGSIKLERTGIFVQGRHLSVCADGIQASVAWVTDMLMWALLAKKRSRNFKGIVLVDEIEQHLHPSWQRRIISRLYDQFPGVQFIATTHSPLCAGAVADLPRRSSYVGRLAELSSGLIECEEISPMEGWRYDKILTSQAFKVSDSRNIQTEKLRRELHRLLDLKRLTLAQKKMIWKLKRKLSIEEWKHD